MTRAWPHEGISALEMWDVIAGGETLFAQRGAPWFYPALVSATLALRAGTAVRADGQALPATAWDSVALVGGALDEARARDAFDARSVPLDVVASDPFFAVSHAREAIVAEGRHPRGVVVIDVGQTAIKACGTVARVHRPRPATASPDPRRDLVAEVASALREASEDVPASFVLLALPCEVGETGGRVTLGPSTYPTGDDGAELVRDILDVAGCASAESAVVNDAVLAAWAIDKRAPAPGRRRLVLTIGLGVGAATIAMRPRGPRGRRRGPA